MSELSLLRPRFNKQRHQTLTWCQQHSLQKSDLIWAAIQVGTWAEQCAPQQQMWQTSLLMVQLLGLALMPGSTARASCHFAGRYRTSWRLCWTGWWEFRERAKQNGDVSVFVKCYTICSKAASKRAHCQLPRFVWVTPSLIHWSAVDCKRVNLSPVFCCRVAMHRIDHKALHAQSPLWHPSSTHFPYLSLID